MKKFLALMVTSTLILSLTSCGDDSVLSSSSAKKALKKEAIFAENFATEQFKTGYYEVSESELTDLQRLKAAGMITLTSEVIIEKVQKRNYDYWRGYTYYTVDREHIFASVQLTEEGKKLEIEEPVTKREDIIKDFKDNENYEETIPDYMTNYETTTTVVAEDPVVEEVVTEEAVEVDSAAVEETGIEEATRESEAAQAPEPAKKDPNAAYNAACAKTYTQEHNMLLGHYELKKVKEVRCSEDMAKSGTGKCLALITFRDKTPFGYVLGAPKQDYISSISVSFIYYQDMGWTVSSFDN